MNLKFINFIILLTLVLALLSCQNLADKDEISNSETALRELIAKKNEWESRKPANYSYTISKTCFCTLESSGPFEIVFKNGLLDTVNYTNWDQIKLQFFIYENFDSTTFVAGAKIYAQKLQIDSLFSDFKNILEQKPDSFFIEYHPDRSFPIRAYFDQSRATADEEFGILISAFQID